jgi:sigma-E factor negative regulatory protein RseC
MNSAECIEQKGVVKEVINGKIMVSLTSFSACAHCHSKNACTLYQSETREVEVPEGNLHLKPGENVFIQIKENKGLRAALLAYFIPFVIILFTLILLSSIGLSELLAGMISVLAITPYFIILYFRRKNLKKTFSFSLRKE